MEEKQEEKKEQKEKDEEATTLQQNREDCFIATATYDSPLAPEVIILQTFRDNILSKFTLGHLAIAVYNCLSPQIARVVKRKRILRDLARKSLRPFVKLASRLIS